jgi:ADP-ribosylation factor-like protein 8
MWEKYCRGVQAIVFVVDSADLDSLEGAREELHSLMSKPSLVGAALLLVGAALLLFVWGPSR